jgi:hypothetical protein
MKTARLTFSSKIVPSILLIVWSALVSIGQVREPLSVVPSDRIKAAINGQVTVRRPGSIHPKARPENDLGTVPPDYQMSDLILMLKRDAAQQAALDELSAAQQDPTSPLFHRWLDPIEFGAHFGASTRHRQDHKLARETGVHDRRHSTRTLDDQV